MGLSGIKSRCCQHGCIQEDKGENLVEAASIPWLVVPFDLLRQ